MRIFTLVSSLFVVVSIGCNPNPLTPCTQDSDCTAATGGYCDLTIGRCRYNTVDGGNNGWTLTLTAPSTGARVNGNATVTAQLSFSGGTPPAAPSMITLTAAPTTGTAVTGQLAKNGTNTYSGPLPTGLTSDQVYTLQGQFPGGASDGGTLLSNTVSVTFDNTPPVFVVTVPPPANRVSHPNLVVYDPDATFDGGRAYRRDESVIVTVTSSATDVDAGSVQLTIIGIGTGATATPVPLSSCAGTGYCGQATVDLSQPVMQRFNGDFNFNATGADTAGNVANPVTAVVGVTRWKWSYSVGSPNIRSSPAVGHLGTIYLGTTAGSAGSLYALNPDGTVKWQDAAGSVTASPAVGAWNGSNELVYAGYSNGVGVGTVLAVLGSDGSDAGSYTAGTDVQSSFALTTTTITGHTPTTGETAVTVMRLAGTNGRLLAFRPFDTTQNFLPYDGIPRVDFPGNVATDDTNFYFGDQGGAVQGFTFVAPGNFMANNTPWPVGTGLTIRSIALGGAIFGGGGAGPGGALFKVTTSGTKTQFPTITSNGKPAWSPVVSSDGKVLYGDETPELKRIPIDLSAVDAHPGTGDTVLGSPILGADHRVYTTNASGTLNVWTSALASEWTAPLGTLSFEASPTVDCSRDGAGNHLSGRPGVLYAGNDDGKLYAVIVDSQGIDITPAGWPKYQHDPRNTGNSSTALTEFTCQ